MSTTLFHTPGLNHYSTPCPRTATPADIDEQLRRPSFNGTGWPRDSPVAETYDVRNSTTQMILLNNRSKSPRLRGYKESKGAINHPDSSRHTTDRPHVNRDAHQKCLNSDSPVFTPEHNVNLGWFNVSKRPSYKFANGSSVNSRRHTSCLPTDEHVLLWKRPRHRNRGCRSAELLRDTSFMDELTNTGEKNYLMSIARVYSVQNLRRVKQSQYDQALRREEHRDVYSSKQCENYRRYLLNFRKTQSGPGEYRVRSAPPLRGQESRTRRESGPRSSTSLSMAKKSETKETKTCKSDTALDKKKSKPAKSEKTRPASCKGHTTSKKIKTASSKKKTSLEKKETTGSKKLSSASDKDRAKTSGETDADKVKTEGAEKREVDVEGSDKENDSDDYPTELTHMHYPSPREGHGRPMSRLGRGSMVSKEESENQDENNDSDFSSDSESTRGREKREKKPVEIEKPAEDEPKEETKIQPRSDGRGGEGEKRKSEEEEDEDDMTSEKSTEYKNNKSYSDKNDRTSEKSTDNKNNKSYSDDKDDRTSEKSTVDKNNKSYSGDKDDRTSEKSTDNKNNKSYSDDKDDRTSEKSTDKNNKSYSDDFSDDEQKGKPGKLKSSSSSGSTDSSTEDSTTERSTTEKSSTYPEKSVVADTSENTTNKTTTSSDSSSDTPGKYTTTDEHTTQNQSPDTNSLSKETEKTPEKDSSDAQEKRASFSREDSVDLTDGKPKDVNKIEY
ncbi:protein starmaker-like [Gigantopelta aegis]|uniref:protein starmaker-like n=1 Tax=Gigantopelta aegis TaxID=1735272 RepID=UPI001B889C0C|nr:protein starmaker-like [Gigantopelta aegis]